MECARALCVANFGTFIAIHHVNHVRLFCAQGYKYFVEAGRVAFINYGEDYGKMVTIVDIADQNRVLVDGENFPRMMMPLRRLSLTKLKVGVQRGARTGTLLKAAKKEGLQGQWDAMPFAKKLALKNKRASLTDLERFQVMVNRRAKSLAIRRKMKVISKGAKKPAGKPAAKAQGKGGKKK